MRGLARMIDLSIVLPITVLISYLLLERKNNTWVFKNEFMFYLVGIIFITLLIIFLYLLPFLTKGKTIGNIVTKTKLEYENNLLKSIVKKEMIFSGSWILTTLVMMITINHTLADRFISSNIKDYSFTTFEHIRINIVTSLSSLTFLLQMVTISSIIVRKDKRSISDVLANVRIIYLNKVNNIQKPTEDKINIDEIIKPTVIQKEPIEWI